MKPAVLSALLIFYFSVQAFCSGNLELVNEREIETDNINDIKIIYASEKVSIYTGTSEKLVIKEYMSENNSRYYANINITGNTLTVEKGESPIRLFNNFNRRVEVYLPVSYRNAVNIKTSSGSIDI
ncbi:MAG: DUF4097 domain-containing protein, partial [Treponema sp.]|nr:DUF4097 domain-containing protein [Treponema sp.]